MRQELLLRGRDEAMSQVLAAWTTGTARVVTLTGLPGVGRARLARHLASSVEMFELVDVLGEVVVVDAGELGDIAMFDSAVAAQTGHIGLGPVSPVDLRTVLAAVPRLLVVIDADRIVGLRDKLLDLVDACGELSLLITAGSPMGLPGERIVRIDSLPTPAPYAAAHELLAEPAVQLFVDVAGASGAPPFDDAALADIAIICTLLGGHPLAIELVASRATAFGPASMRSMMERSSPSGILRRPSATAADGPGPLDAIAWVVDLVEPESRRVLGDLLIFRSSVPFEAIETVLGDDELIDHLSLLVDLHLVDVANDPDSSRYRLHPLVRTTIEALDGPQPSPRRSDLEALYLEWAVGVASIAAQHPIDTWPTVTDAIERVEPDLIVALRQAIDWKDASAAAQIANALSVTWFERGVTVAHLDLMGEVIEFIERGDTELPDGLRALVEVYHAVLLVERGLGADDAQRIADNVQRATERAADSDPTTRLRVLAAAVLTARGTGVWDRATVSATEGAAIAAANGDQISQAWFEYLAGMVAHQQGDIARAVELAFSAFRRAGNFDAPSLRLNTAGFIRTLPLDADAMSETPTAERLVREAERLGDRRALLWLRPVATGEALRRGDLDGAVSGSVATLESARAAGAWIVACVPTMVLAHVAAARSLDADAARLHGMIADRIALVRTMAASHHVDLYLDTIDAVRVRLGAADFDAHAASGAVLAPSTAANDALHFARTALMPSAAPAPDAELAAADAATRDLHEPLSPREAEVVTLLATGATNSQIADRLFISPKTVMHHTSNIYRKLGVRGRAQAVAWFSSQADPRR